MSVMMMMILMSVPGCMWRCWCWAAWCPPSWATLLTGVCWQGDTGFWLAYMDITDLWLVGREKQPTCVDIPSNMTLCHNIGKQVGNIVSSCFICIASLISWLFDLVKCSIPVFSTENSSEKLDSRSRNWLLRYHESLSLSPEVSNFWHNELMSDWSIEQY